MNTLENLIGKTPEADTQKPQATEDKPKNLGGRPRANPAPVAAAPVIDYEKLADMVASRMAPAVNISRGKERFAEEFPVGQHSDLSIDATSGGGIVQCVEGPLCKSYLDELAFMEEVIEVVVHETDDPAAENPVPAACNGRIMYFQRGVPTRAKRCIVNSLLCKSDRVTTPEYTNPGGERLRSIKRTSALKYPVSVIGDSGRGVQWLRMRMAEVNG